MKAKPVLISQHVIQTTLAVAASLCFALMTLAACHSPEGSATAVRYPDSLQAVHNNLVAYYLNQPVDTAEVNQLRQGLDEPGAWPTIDYTNRKRGNWPVSEHLEHVQALAIAYQAEASPYYHDQQLSTDIHRALDYWLTNDFLSTNWWDQQIGVPQLLAPILFLIEDELSTQQLQQGLTLLRRAQIKMTGQNKVWLSGNVLLRSLLVRDADSVAMASHAIQEELTVATGEGVQPDGSYHQHGPQLQFGNYGLSYLEDMIKWYTLLDNTPFHFEKSKIAILRDYILQGQRWVLWKDKVDISACGRQLFIDEPAKKAHRLKDAIQAMAVLDEPHAQAYREAADYRTLVGNKHFWRSDFHVQRTNDYYFSVKMSSTRVAGAETVNRENVQGYHMGDGVTFLYQAPEDYENIFPFFDWKKLPGITAIQDTAALPMLTAAGYHIDSDFVGGVSDGETGIAVLDYRRDGLQAHKAWFMFNDKIVCLGSGIRADTPFSVATGVDQVFLSGEVVIHNDQHPNGKNQLTDPEWILHNRTGYLFPNGGTLELQTRYFEGTWNTVANRYRPVILTEQLFRLWFDHGANPQNEAYQYVLIPGADQEKMSGLQANQPFEITNQRNRQVVVASDGSVAGAVFYKPGRAAVFGGIEVDQPCVVMLKKQPEGLEVSFSDPTHTVSAIRFSIHGNYQGEHSSVEGKQTILSVALPGGEKAGSTVSLWLKER